MKIIEIKEEQKNRWDDFIKSSPNGSLLQSFGWGNFQKSLGRKIWRLMVNNSQVLGATLIVKHNLPFKKSYLYCPRGPIVRYGIIKSHSHRVVLRNILKRIREIAKRENSIFLRIDPTINPDSEFFASLLLYNFKAAKRQVQPRDTLVLNITKNEDELLAPMHYKTRYNIRLAKRKGVKVRQSTDLKDIDIFWDLLQETIKREKFKPHSKEYYKKQIETLGTENLIKLFLAEYKGKVIACNIVSFFGDAATYLHGASLYQYRNLMAPHLLQWEAILEAKKQGCKLYDFWGIAPQDVPNHPWLGITRFKKGFGGKEIHYIGAWDKVYQPGWYRLYSFTKRIL